MHNLMKYILQFILFFFVFVVVEAVVCLIVGRPLFSLVGWQKLLVIVLAVLVNELLVCLWTRRTNARKRKNRDSKYDELFDEAGI